MVSFYEVGVQTWNQGSTLGQNRSIERKN